jgi:type IV secretion system protein VirB5
LCNKKIFKYKILAGVFMELEKSTVDDPSNSPEENPYLAARREWNERYGGYIASKIFWRRMAFIAIGIAAGAVIGLLWIANKSQVIPYVVEVDNLGRAQMSLLPERVDIDDPRIIRAEVNRFVEDWRIVTVDGANQKRLVNRLYARIVQPSPALDAINEWFNTYNPFERGRSEIVTPEILGTLPVSDDTWEVEWTETVRTLNGRIASRVRYKAGLIVKIVPPRDIDAATASPLGFGVYQLTWARQAQ